MNRIELKIPSRLPSNPPKTCLFFCYQRRFGSREETIEVGFGVLRKVADALRKDYEVSEPSTGKKSFGITWITCRSGDAVMGISLFPPEDGDEWQIQASWFPGQPRRNMSESEIVAWEAIRTILNEAVTHIEGAKDLLWLSAEDAWRRAEHVSSNSRRREPFSMV